MASSVLWAMEDVKINPEALQGNRREKRLTYYASRPSPKQCYISEVFANWIGCQILGINLYHNSPFSVFCIKKMAKENPEVTFIFLSLMLTLPPPPHRCL